jgi:hypothetical protein
MGTGTFDDEPTATFEKRNRSIEDIIGDLG